MTPNTDTAQQIAEAYLRDMASHVINGNFAAYQRGVMLPFAHMTGDGLSLVRDEATLRAGFDAYRDSLAGLHVVAITQDVTEAERLDDGHIVAYYTLSMDSTGDQDLPSHTGWVMLSRTPEGTWATGSVTSFVRNQGALVEMPFRVDFKAQD